MTVSRGYAETGASKEYIFGLVLGLMKSSAYLEELR